MTATEREAFAKIRECVDEVQTAVDDHLSLAGDRELTGCLDEIKRRVEMLEYEASKRK